MDSAGAAAAGVVARARSGDREALEELLASVAPAIRRFGLRMCKNVHDADDVLQDTLISIAKHLDGFEGRSSLASWAFVIARSACARKRRGRKNQPHLGDDQLDARADATYDPEAKAASGETARLLSRALDSLSDEHREVILLRDVEGLAAPEVADSLGVSVAAVKSRLHRARDALRQALQPLLAPMAASTLATCPDVGTLWSKKLEGDLSAGDCAAMESHLKSCRTCTAACDTLKQALFACQSERSAPLPPQIQDRVKVALRACAIARPR